MKNLQLSWQVVVLVCFLSTLVLVVLAWMVHDGKAQASVLIGPLGTFLGAATGYVVGLNRRPPWLDDVHIEAHKALPTVPPAPSDVVDPFAPPRGPRA